MKHYNVVIIGAGPAGSFLAYKLKNHGINVLILDKERFPRYKSCAGGIAKKAYDILYSENKNIKNIVEKTIRKGLHVSGNRFTFTDSKKDLIFMTYRADFDDFLIKMAADGKNIIFKDNVRVKSINQKDNTLTFIEKNKNITISYDVLVGAWGGCIRLNNIVGLNPFERFSVSSSWEGPAGNKFGKYFNEHALCQIINKYPGIAFYIFPKSKNITAGLFTSLHPVSYSLKEIWGEFVRFWELDGRIKPKYALIPVRDFNIPIAKENLLLVGDAAGLADPFTGEGIYYALVSSRIASKHILKYLENKNYDLANGYDKDIYLSFFEIHKWAKRYEFLFQNFTKPSFWLGSEVKVGNEIITSFITGEIKYNEIKKIFRYIVNRNF